jgi:hypothetical protein
MWRTSPTNAQPGYLRALCCACGRLRTVRFGSWPGLVGEGPRGPGHTDPRCLLDAACDECRQVTRHAYLRDFEEYADSAEWSEQEHAERVHRGSNRTS